MPVSPGSSPAAGGGSAGGSAASRRRIALDDERHRAELHPVARAHRDGLADQPAVEPGAVVRSQVAEHPAALAPDQQGVHPGHRQVGQAQIAVAGPPDGEPDPAARREEQRRRVCGGGRRRGPHLAARSPGNSLRPRPVRRSGDLLGPRDTRVPVRPAVARGGILAPQGGPDPGQQSGAARRQVGEQARQLAAVPRVEGALHAVHEGLVRQAALSELVPELADRVIALRVGGAEEFGRCGRVRRRPSHEWSIGIIRSQGKRTPDAGPAPAAGDADFNGCGTVLNRVTTLPQPWVPGPGLVGG